MLHALARKDLPVNLDDDDGEDDGLEKLAAFENLILYIPEKLYLSPRSADLLSTLPLEGKFLLGYLNMWPDGRIKSSHLLMQNTRVWNQKFPEENRSSEIVEAFEPSQHEAINSKSPLDEELEALANSRKNDLQEIKIKILSELDQHLIENTATSIKQANDLLDAYELLAIKYNLMIKETLSMLRHKYADVPLDAFQSSVKEAGLMPFIDEDESYQ